MADVMVYSIDLAIVDQVFEFDVGADETLDFDLSTAIQVGGTAPTYAGPYVVTPRPYDPVELETRDKLMADNVTVLKVPYYETSNIYDGKTVFIAEDIDNG